MAQASKVHFSDFVEKIILQTGVETLHFIAHSMGNIVLTETLEDLSNRQTLNGKLNVIQQIVLGAPDIDQSVFRKNILPYFHKIGCRRTLYSSDKDIALHFSKDLRKGLSRLGEAGNSLFVEKGVDTIDASNVPSSFIGHSYIFDTKELLNDLYYLLDKGIEPAERFLREKKKNNLIYWLFPK